jgi:hypothetical protein
MWTKDRIEELEELEDVLDSLTSLNNSSNFLANVEYVIDRAKKLTRTDYRKARVSFVDFLKEKAME